MTTTTRTLAWTTMLLTAAVASGAETTLEFELVDNVNWRGDKAEDVPGKVTETYRYDPQADAVSVTCKFDSKGFAPLPPMLALAVEHGLEVSLDRDVRKTGQTSVLGPLMGVDGVDSYTWSIRGLGKYVLGREKLGDAEAPPELRAELDAQVGKIVQAGHLRPWLVLVNVPGSGASDRGETYWLSPAETLYLLAEAAPALSSETRNQLVKYLRTVRRQLPPETVAAAPLSQGAPREYDPPNAEQLRQGERWIMPFLTNNPPRVWALYGLSRYYDLVDEAPSSEVMAACTRVVSRALGHLDWATLYWRRGHTPAFNAVHGVNQLFAGFVGYIRLARRAGDAKAEALGWGMLARIAALRFAMGKYTQYMHANEYFNRYYHVGVGFWRKESKDVIERETGAAAREIPDDPAWFVKQHAGNWHGELLTFNWTKPIHNVRQVHRLDETGVDVWEWGGVDNNGNAQKRDAGEKKDYWYGRKSPYYLAFRDMTPELGAFLADHLKPECRAFLDRVEENQPHWYAAYAEAVIGAEYGFMSPCNAHDLFLAEAWVLDGRPADVIPHVDVPWLKMGDLFYVHKLAEAIKVARGRSWSAGLRPR